MMPGTDEVTYLVLAERAIPYLLARVRWPDVAQAISARSPDWLEDPGLFDLPYEPSAVTLSFPQAASVAEGWGRQLHPGAAEGVPSYMRRMPANWSDLSPSERRAWGIEFVGRRRSQARRARRLPSSKARRAVVSAAQANGTAGGAAEAGAPPRAGGPATSASSQVVAYVSVETERRNNMRVRVDGRAHIRSGNATISAGLVDLSEGGLGCILPEPSSALVQGTRLQGPFLIEAGATTWRICLDVAGRIIWHSSTGAGTQFGVAFGELDEGETDGVQRFIAAACSRRGNR
jgi:PilZ domain